MLNWLICKSGYDSSPGGFRKQMENFTFVFLLVLQCKVLQELNIVSKLLQGKDDELGRAASLLKTATDEIQNYICL